MDIQSSTNTATQSIASTGQSGALESAATERKEAADSSVERKEVEASDTGPDVGQNVDIQA